MTKSLRSLKSVIRPSFRPKQFAALLSVFLLLTDFAVNAQAPTISYSNPAVYLTNTAITPLAPVSSNVAAPTGAYGAPVTLGSGLSFSQNELALDAAGNMYVNDQVGGTGVIKKITADGSSTTVIGSGFLTQSAGVAVDKAGNVYVADQAQVWKIPASGSPVSYGTPVVINNSFTRPFAIAADNAGNIYVSDLTNGGVYKMANDGTNKVRIDNGINNCSGVTVDAAGNVYAVDYSTLDLYEIPANGNPQVQLATGFTFPRAIAVDGAGTIYVGDEGKGDVYTVPAGGGSPVPLFTGLSSLVGVAVDANYNLYLALQGNTGISKSSPTGGYFISPQLPAGLSFDNTTGIISGTPTVAGFAKNYTITAYNTYGSSSATIKIQVRTIAPAAISYASPQTYIAGTAITPLAPTATGVDAPAYSTSAYPVETGLLAPLAVATDPSGNVYVADKGNNEVKEFVGGYGGAIILGSGFNAPTGVAVDHAGNVYVADSGNGLVDELPAGGGAQVSIGTGFTSPAGVAVDSAGNVYVADAGNATVYKIEAGSGNTVVVMPGFNNLTGIAVDISGNVYVTDGSGDAVYKIKPGAEAPENIGGRNSFGFPANVAVDASGNVFVADGNNHLVYEIAGGRGNAISLGITFSSPSGVAVDAAGKIYVDDAITNNLQKIVPEGGYYVNRPLPIGLKLNDTTGTISGTPKLASAATNYIIRAYNAGGGARAALNITVTAPPVPVISYTSPQTYTAGTAITALSPANTGGAVAGPGYSTSPVSIGSGFSQPFGIAFDAAGNVYVADANNSAIEEYSPGGATLLNTYSGFDYPTGVAVDATGNIYVADNSNVYQIPAGGGSPVVWGSGFTDPDGVAVDAAGNVYVTDAGATEGAGILYKIPAGNGTPVVLGSGFDYLTAIAVDQSNNLYFVDGGASTVYKVSANGGIPAIVGPPFVFPTGIAVDPAGDLYVTDGDASAVYKLTKGGFGGTFSVGSEFNDPGGVAVDGAGNLYVGDTNNNQVDEITPVGGYFINTQLPAGLRFDGTTGNISGTPKRASAATDYTITAYNAGGSGAATVNIAVSIPPVPAISYATPQTYTAGTAITPLSPSNTGGNVAFPGYSASPVNIGSGFSFNNPFDVALDAAGNIYVADAGNSAVEEFAASGGALINTYSGFDYPTGVAVDAAGNIYVADQGAGQVYEIPIGGGPNITLGSGFSGPNAIVLDAAGNVYVTDDSDGDVYKIPAGNGAPVTLGTGFQYLTAITIDGAGNLYIVDGGASTVYKLSTGGGIPVPVADSFIFPTGAGIDASGNLYVLDGDANALYKLPKGSSGQIQIANGFNEPGGLAIDGSGNLYIGDTNNNAVEEIAPVGGYFINTPLPAGLSLDNKTGIISGTATVGSAATNYTITGYNAGGGSAATVNITVNLPPAPTLSYITPQIYTLGVAITPLLPAASGVAYPAYSSTITTVGTGFSFPSGVALDHSGNIYVADADNNAVTEIAAAGGTQTNIGAGFSFSGPVGVAVDAAGNIYVADGGNSAVEEFPAGGGAEITLGSGFNYPAAVAVDMAGNVYVADEGLGEVIEVPAGNGTPVSIGSGFLYPSSVAVDAAGNVYVTDIALGKAFEIPVGGGHKISIGGFFNAPSGIAVDASGNVYISDAASSLVKELPAGGGSAVTITGLGIPYGLAVDGAGNLYVGNTGNNVVDVVKPIGGYYISPVLSAGLNFNSATGAISGTPTATSPGTNHTVTAYNPGGSVTSVVNTKVVLPSAYLSYLTINSGALTPAFTHLTTSYTVSLPNNISSITLTPTTRDPNATVTVGGTRVASGSSSPSIPLTVGPNTINIKVLSSDGTTTTTYTITVTRESRNADLSSLTLSSGALSPVFSSGTQNYTASVGNAITSVYLTPTASDPSATGVTVNSVAVTSGTASGPIELNVGQNLITIIVKARDPDFTKTYTVTVIRESRNDGLSGLAISNGTLSPVVASGIQNYATSVANSVASVTVTPTTSDPSASGVTVNGVAVTSGAASGPVALNVGLNTITIIVAAHDPSFTKTYTITVTRESGNDNLSALTLSSGTLSPVFSGTVKTYTTSVANSVASVTVTPTTSDPSATGVTVNGIAVTSGSASGPVVLNAGLNTITVIVTAHDPSFTKTYTVTVTRESGNDNLSALTLSSGTLSPVFSGTVKTYTASVGYGVSTLTVTPTTSDPSATGVTVNGITVKSGTASGPVALNAGPNTITVIVTAHDPSFTKTYTVTVTRAPSTNAVLSRLSISAGTLSPAFATETTSYSASVGNGVTSVTVTPTTSNSGATVTVNGMAVTSASASGPVALNVGSNAITTIVTAQDGVTKKTYTITVTRESGSDNTVYQPVSVETPADSPQLADDGIIVHRGVSPNGDGIDDFLQIDNITSYPDNRLMIMNRNGILVYEVKGYDNISRIFDGHSNKTGQMQLPGTYFYSLDYTVKGIAKHKTGFLVLKY